MSSSITVGADAAVLTGAAAVGGVKDDSGSMCGGGDIFVVGHKKRRLDSPKKEPHLHSNSSSNNGENTAGWSDGTDTSANHRICSSASGGGATDGCGEGLVGEVNKASAAGGVLTSEVKGELPGSAAVPGDKGDGAVAEKKTAEMVRRRVKEEVAIEPDTWSEPDELVR